MFQQTILQTGKKNSKTGFTEKKKKTGPWECAMSGRQLRLQHGGSRRDLVQSTLYNFHIVQLPHTTEYHIKPPVHENCSYRLQWACELENLVSKLQLACVLYSASSWLHSSHLLYFGKIAVAIDCHFLKSNPQTCWIRVSVNFNNSINSEHRADFVHSDFVLAI